MSNIREVLICLSVKYNGNWGLIRDAIARKERLSDEEIKESVGKISSSCVTLLDPEYPECLKNIFKPPFVVYYKGDFSLLKKGVSRLGVVGSRKCTSYGERAVKKIISDLYIKGNEDVVIVSGMAKGIDGISEKEAMKNNRKVISVLGCGVDICYPSDNQDIYDYCSSDKGLIISEYPDNVIPSSENFPMRNRILSGIADSMLIGEASEASGTSITVRCCLDNGKEILCIPTDIFSEKDLCNKLIQDGATMCLSEKDVLDSLKRTY